MAFQMILQELLYELGASRITLRLDTPGEIFPVVSEALAPGIHSIKGDTKVGDVRRSATYEWIAREQRILVQDDLITNPDPVPPRVLIEDYGAKAQMLAPIVRDGRLHGIISVHYAPGPRKWTDADVAVLERAVARVHAELDAQRD